MNINICSIRSKAPSWIDASIQEYQKRMPKEFNINLIDVPATKRLKTSNIQKIVETEGVNLTKKIPQKSFVVALDQNGKVITTEEFSKNIIDWFGCTNNISMLIGGPDGLSRQRLDNSDYVLSLSRMTFPHAVVKILLVEQIYRAAMMLNNHPYNR